MIAAESSRALLERYLNVRAHTLALAEPLGAEDMVAQSMPDASPTKWHLAHTTWFFETFALARFLPSYAPVHPAYATLFNSYYVAIGPRHPRAARGVLTRPPLGEVLAYRARIDEQMGALLARDPPAPLLDVVQLGIAHEEQHQELLLTDIHHLFSMNPLAPAYAPPRAEEDDGGDAALRFVRFAEGVRETGHAGEGFAFDNEGPRHKTFVAAFELADRLVTNAEYGAFVDDGGYDRPELWLDDGWTARAAGGWTAPLYWRRTADGFVEHTLRGERPVRPREPVCHVSFYEADAFARWAGARLATEAEWEVAASGRPVAGNFVETRALHPTAARAEDGVLRQLFGDAWEWTRSAYEPYPGYAPAAGAIGEYNGKFMSNKYVLRGGSCASPQHHLRATYRNFFPPDARWQFSGIRLARDVR